MKRTLLLIFAAALLTVACSNDDAANTTLAPADSPDSTNTTEATTVPPSATTSTTTAASTTSTAAPVTTVPPPAITPGEDPDVDTVVLAYEIVFSSEIGFDEKAPNLVDPTGLEETVTEYQETGESMGGVALAPTAVTFSGDVADVSYDLPFAGTPAYPDLSGNAVLVDDTWKITRDMFCGMMASARVGCPDS